MVKKWLPQTISTDTQESFEDLPMETSGSRSGSCTFAWRKRFLHDRKYCLEPRRPSPPCLHPCFCCFLPRVFDWPNTALSGGHTSSFTAENNKVFSVNNQMICSFWFFNRELKLLSH